MWAVGSTESIYSYVNNHTSSYSPALDLYFQHTLPHQQSIQVNVTGTLIHTKNNRKYKEYKDENAPLADIQTLVDGDKMCIRDRNKEVLKELNDQIKGAFAKSDDPHTRESGHRQTY